MRFPFVVFAFIGCAVGCLEEDSPHLNRAEQKLSTAQRLKNVTAIRDVAAEEGLFNAAVLGGIAQSETGLAHCWQDATWSCKGPNSSSCAGGPVVAGSADGECSLEEGGLGMFQFDAGTYEETIARDGEAVLTLEGNIAKAVDFVTDKVIQDIDGVKNKAQALDWINSIPMVVGDQRTEQWASLLACRYNGCCNSSNTCTTRRADYRDNAIDIYNEFGAGFWNTKTEVEMNEDSCCSADGNPANLGWAGLLFMTMSFHRARSKRFARTQRRQRGEH